VAKTKKKPTLKAKKKVKKTKAKSVRAKKRAPKTAVLKTAKTKGFPEQMLAVALKVLDERKAEQIVAVSLAGRSALADYLVIASGKTSRQVIALADHLREAFFKIGARHVRVEGKEDANWVIVDAGDVIAHLFRPEVRKYYNLDALWNKKASKK